MARDRRDPACSSSCFVGIHRHYRRFARRLSAGAGAVRAARRPTNEVLLAVESIDVATEGALWYARQIAERHVSAGTARAVQAHGSRDQAALVGLRAGAASARAAATAEGSTQALLEEVWRLPRGESDFVTVIVPEQFKRPSLLSARAAQLVPAEAAAALGARRRRHRRAGRHRRAEAGGPHAEAARRPGTDGRRPRRIAASAQLRTVARASRTRALCRSHSTRSEADRFRDAYLAAGLTVPVDLSDAPYRDIGTPLLAYIRELTADPDTVVNIVMPEIVVRGWARFLHNQRALYIKRLLLFERHVILSSVPYQLFR